jgi:CheY-like chemotaxis protein
MTAARQVLMVEDDENLRQALTRYLRGRGIGIVEAASAEDAGESLRGGLRPSLILLDLNLPGETGWEFLRHHDLASAGNPPVIVTSATPVSPARLAEFHVAGYLPKPCPPEALVDAIERLALPAGTGVER